MTQVLLGGAIAAAIVPAGHRRAALLAGAALGTLPDLDSVPLMLWTDDPVLRMTMHRSASHSLLVLPLVALAIWAWFRSRGKRVSEAPLRWWWAILLALVTHPMLDAFTVYGTQLWWPLPAQPTMWSSIFIIDPVYTVWLLVACVIAWVLPRRPLAQRALVAGLVVSTAYLGWSLLAKAIVDTRAERSLALLGQDGGAYVSVPMPATTLLWRIVVMTPDGYQEAFHSLVADGPGLRFCGYPSDTVALSAAADIPAVQRLRWFNHGFMRAQVSDGELQLSDLRMGAEPDYFFRFAVAGSQDNRWTELRPPRQLHADRDLAQLWDTTWTRIWERPAQANCVARPPLSAAAHAAH